MKDSIDEILAGLSSAKSSERKIALVRVARSRPAGLLTLVVTALTDADGEVRAAAAWALDELGDPEAIPALINALYDKLFDVRSNAGWALVHLAQRMTPHLVVPEMIDILRDGNDFDARQMARLVLEHIGGKDALDALNQYRE
jgi:hypothetical protein